jgi:hypothetical protein
MSPPDDLDARVLLRQTFEKLKILHEGDPRPLTASWLSHVYWRETSVGEIDLVFSKIAIAS